MSSAKRTEEKGDDDFIKKAQKGMLDTENYNPDEYLEPSCFNKNVYAEVCCKILEYKKMNGKEPPESEFEMFLKNG